MEIAVNTRKNPPPSTTFAGHIMPEVGQQGGGEGKGGGLIGVFTVCIVSVLNYVFGSL